MVQRISPVMGAAYMQLNSETPRNRQRQEQNKKKTAQKPFSQYLKDMEYVIGVGYLV